MFWGKDWQFSIPDEFDLYDSSYFIYPSNTFKTEPKQSNSSA